MFLHSSAGLSPRVASGRPPRWSISSRTRRVGVEVDPIRFDAGACLCKRSGADPARLGAAVPSECQGRVDPIWGPERVGSESSPRLGTWVNVLIYPIERGIGMTATVVDAVAYGLAATISTGAEDRGVVITEFAETSAEAATSLLSDAAERTLRESSACAVFVEHHTARAAVESLVGRCQGICEG